MGKGGRHSNYESLVMPKFPSIEKWTREGLTQDQIAKNLGVGVSTFRTYVAAYQELSETLKKGKAVAVAEVENALFRRALGYEYEETKTYFKDSETGLTKYTETTKRHLPPDVAACFILLKNKDKGNWSNEPMKMDLERQMVEWRKELEEQKAWT